MSIVTLTHLSTTLFVSSSIGALPALAVSSLSSRSRAVIEGLCAGAMLSASWLSLLVPAIAKAPGVDGKLGVILALVLGYVLLQGLRAFRGIEGSRSAIRKKDRAWLIGMAIALHNMPEGFAVGVGAHQEGVEAKTLLYSVGLQNLPEGFIVAASLMVTGAGIARILMITALTGVVEVVGAVLGWWSFQILEQLLPWGLAFAAGAMLFVVCREMIPECQKEHESQGTLGMLLGICVVLLLQVLIE